MSVSTADRSLDHLFPSFRVRLEMALGEMARLTGEPWAMTEGYRSAERQTWLFAAGRTRPGKVVTWLRTPLLHGAGLAADCIPKGKGYGAPKSWWETYRRVYQKHGLGNTAWGKGDMTHVEWNDPAIRARALVWVRAGFRDPTPDPTPASVSVLVDGEPVPDAAAYLEQGRAWVMLRPVTDGLDLVIAEVIGKGEDRVAHLVDDRTDVLVPVKLKAGRAYVRAAELPATTFWLPAERIVSIARKT